MKQRPFGQTGITVSELGLGTSPLGGGIFYRDDKEALAVLRAAFDAGITYFDTAENYGTGQHEVLLGQVFGRCRDQVVIASKGGLQMTPLGEIMLATRALLGPFKNFLKKQRRAIGLIRDSQKRYSFHPDHLRRSLEGTLQRLNSDYVDVYQFFNATDNTFERDDVFDIMDRFKQEGKIRFSGATVISLDHAIHGLRHQAMDVIQVPVSLLDQKSVHSFVPLAEERTIALVGRSPLAGGFLTSATGHIKAIESSFVSNEGLAVRRQKAEQLRALVGEDKTLSQFALQYALQVKGVSTVLFSAANRDQLTEDLKALEAAPLRAEEIQTAEQIVQRS
jgi:aryl-alcohol dehydrogenase-like predicted oxidoreductase